MDSGEFTYAMQVFLVKQIVEVKSEVMVATMALESISSLR